MICLIFKINWCDLPYMFAVLNRFKCYLYNLLIVIYILHIQYNHLIKNNQLSRQIHLWLVHQSFYLKSKDDRPNLIEQFLISWFLLSLVRTLYHIILEKIRFDQVYFLIFNERLKIRFLLYYSAVNLWFIFFGNKFSFGNPFSWFSKNFL